MSSYLTTLSGGRLAGVAGASTSSVPGADEGPKRMAAAALGGTLLVLGLRRRFLVGAAMALAGGWLLSRAFGTGPTTDREGRDAESTTDRDGATIERSITVGESPDELYEFVRDPENLDRIVGPVADVTSSGEDRHRWSVEGPLGRTLSWETEIVEEQPGESLRWEAVDGSLVSADGSIDLRPAPGDRGTRMTLRARVDPPGGRYGAAALERLDIVPESLVGAALDRSKSLVETGEIPTTARSPSARGKGDLV